MTPVSYFVELYGDTVRNRVLSIFLLHTNNAYTALEVKGLLSDEGLELSKKSVYRSLKELKQVGLVIQDGLQGNAKTYRYAENLVSEAVREGYLKALLRAEMSHAGSETWP